MAFIDRRGKRISVRWRDPDGRRRRRSGFATLDAAKTFKREVEDCVASGKRWEPRDRVPPPDLETAGGAYLMHRAATMKSERTQINENFVLRNFENFAGPRRSITELSQTMLEGFYLWLRQPTGRHGRARSLDTAAKNVRIVQRFWLWLSRHDEFAKHTPPPRMLDGLPRDPQSPVAAATWAEMDAAIAAGGAWYPISMFVMRALGLRVSQAMGARVGDVAADASAFKLRGELGKTLQERRGRVVPIAPALRPLFLMLIDGRGPDEWLVPSRRARGMREREVRTEYVRDAWVRADVRAEVWQGRPDHAFRKGFVSELRRAGADPDAIEVLVGHSLGLRGVYTAGDAHPLDEAVGKIAPMSTAAHERIVEAIKTEVQK